MEIIGKYNIDAGRDFCTHMINNFKYSGGQGGNFVNLQAFSIERERGSK